MKGVGAEGRSEVRVPSRVPIVLPPPRGRETEPVIMLPRKPAKLHPRGTRTADRHRQSGRAYQGVERFMVKELGKLTP